MRLRSVDLFRSVPSDLTEQTTVGALVSVVSLLFICYLFLTELAAFLSPSTTVSMFVDHPVMPHHYASSAQSPQSALDSYDLLTVNINVSLPALPCCIASLDVQDVMGAHQEDVQGALHKTRIDSDSLQPRRDDSGRPLSGDGQHSVEQARQQRGEGCNIAGRVVVRKVPGNLHLSGHSHPELLSLLSPTAELNVSHVFHSLYFGDDDSLLSVQSAVTQPLAGTRRIAQPVVAVNQFGQSLSGLPSYEYYLKLVPTQFVSSLQRRPSVGFQYIAHSNVVGGRYRLAAVYLRYDVDAITVRLERRLKSLPHFLVQLLAITGGVFTVLGLLNSIIVTAAKRFKQEIGKLG